MKNTTLRWVLAAGFVGVSIAGGFAVEAASGPAADAARPAVGKHASEVDRGSQTARTEQFTAAAVSAGQFTAITPYRAYDTRVNETDKVRNGDDYNVDMLTDYQGVAMIPATATAISFNVTVTDTESTFGFATIFNGDAAAVPDTSTINWVLPNFSIANGGIVALGVGAYVGQIGLAMDGAAAAAAEVIIDVTGYYTP